MTALRSPLSEAASIRALHVCTTCARRLLDKGYEKEKGSIEYGSMCEAHPVGQGTIQATSLINAPESEVTTPVQLAPIVLDGDDDADDASDPLRPQLFLGGEVAPPPAPTSIGPLTELTARLVVAWSTAERVADPFLVDAAITVAREILRKTGGA